MYKSLRNRLSLFCLITTLHYCTVEAEYESNINCNNSNIDYTTWINEDEPNIAYIDTMNFDQTEMFEQIETIANDSFGISTITFQLPEGFYLGQYNSIDQYILDNYPILNYNGIIKVWHIEDNNFFKKNKLPIYYIQGFDKLVQSINSFSNDLNNGLYNPPEPCENATGDNYFLMSDIFSGFENMFSMIVTALLQSSNVTNEQKNNITQFKHKYLELFKNIKDNLNKNIVPRHIYDFSNVSLENGLAGWSIIDNPYYEENTKTKIISELMIFNTMIKNITDIISPIQCDN